MTPKHSRFALLTRLVSLLVALAAVEAVVVPLGVFVPAEFRDRHVTLFGLLEPHPELGFRARANLRDFEVSWMGNSLRGRYSTDAHGFRNAGRNYEDSRMFFVGDSFTWGSWLPREETFPDLVEAGLGIPIANLAQESYYIEQYEKVVHLLFEELLEDDETRYVALCIFANDLTTPITDEDLKDFYSRYGWDQYREYPLHRRMFVFNLVRFFWAGAEGLAIASGLHPPAPPSHLDHETTAGGVKLYRQLGAHPYYFSQGYNRHTEAVFRRLLLYIRDHNATPLVFLLPSKESAYKDEYLRLFPGDYLEIEKTGYQRLCEVAASLGASCMDLTAAFRTGSEDSALYFDQDPHWNRDGHWLAASKIIGLFRSLHGDSALLERHGAGEMR